MPRPKDVDTAEGRQRHEAKYQRILAAALEVFARKGFHEAKISEIARSAGVADGTIYLYFKNKDDVLISLFEAKLEQINAGLRDGLDKITDVRERLTHVIRYHLQLALNDPTLAAFITIELRRSAKFMKQYAKAQLAEYLNQWGQIVDEGKAQGVFRPEVSTGILKHIMFGALDQACVTWVNNPQRTPADLIEVGKQLSDLVLRAVSAPP
jgi:TetR/AcrR family fatty acid metabolism transcriptional regulator